MALAIAAPAPCPTHCMNVFELTRALIDIESITPNETAVGEYLFACLERLRPSHIEYMDVEPGRRNVFARFGDAPLVTLSTHMDTVPPFFAAREDADSIWGRGACDTKGIIAAMIGAAEQLIASGDTNFGLLFVVGEERNSAGALHAATQPRGAQFLINGEPTSNRLALGSKGALRYEIKATGKLAHSAYPELGESAVLKLLDALGRIRALELPVDPVLGKSTLNIATLTAGRAPNVIPDDARAEIFIRLVGDSQATRKAIEAAVRPDAEAQFVLEIPAVHLGSLPGFETTVVAYTTDIPAFGSAWGKPYLLGPGTIHVAHTLEERVPKKELTEAVDLYAALVRSLKN